ncbi:hypothetical protein niasHT_036416 [Heterodera trifolii]|uniref:NR LBD domain-containing protein n=1 Tax=Heterodera trifolii TaxID=157864 RepID=A0ABD2HQR9_9BILA
MDPTLVEAEQSAELSQFIQSLYKRREFLQQQLKKKEEKNCHMETESTNVNHEDENENGQFDKIKEEIGSVILLLRTMPHFEMLEPTDQVILLSFVTIPLIAMNARFNPLKTNSEIITKINDNNSFDQLIHAATVKTLQLSDEEFFLVCALTSSNSAVTAGLSDAGHRTLQHLSEHYSNLLMHHLCTNYGNMAGVFRHAELVHLTESLIPDYWTTIYRSGHIEPGRSNEQFITFPNSKHMYIGYWISSEKHYHEAYGSVYSDGIDDRGTQYCGTFADVYQNKSAKICGSFRILSSKRNATTNPFEFVPISDAIKNPEKAVEYLDWQIARFRTNSSEKWVIGCSNILKRIAYFPHNGGQLKKIDFKENVRTILDNNVQVLQRSAAFDPRDLYEQVPSVAQIAAATRRTTAKKLTTKTMPKTTRITMKTTSTTTETPAEHEHDYDNLAGAGIEWDANLEAKPPSDSSQKLEGGAVLSVADNELILPKQK